ncbi:alkane 1-monooxygenase [Nereida sp. MMG024]|nr:alkane 1-monooxygenase [Nereida sp. MMG025]MCF6443806.1 alkane 1-monooxygenase [Nereida sp. MMG025]
MVLFSAVTLTIVALLAAGALWGGLWILGAAAYMTLVTFVMDEFIDFAATDAPKGAEFPHHDLLSVILGLAHFMLLGLGIAAISGATGLSTLEKIEVFVAFGLFFGQVSNSNAHELIHRSKRPLFSLGKWIYISLLFGHHTSAHRHLHHRFVGTKEDPNTARLGESFYVFFWRAWRQSFVKGWRLEQAITKMASPPRKTYRNPYYDYIIGAAVLLGVSAVIGGATGPLIMIAFALNAQVQLMLSDYVQHYGLTRAYLPSGKLEPIAAHHSWNAPHWFSSALMLNAPRHSDHHAHPAKPYSELHMPSQTEAPILPRSLPVMACLALYPAFWRKVMDDRARAWSAQTHQTSKIAAE